MGRGGERKAGQGTGPKTEPLATLRLKVGAETEDPLRRQRTNFAERAVVAGEATWPERRPRGETSWTPLRDRRLAGGPTCPPPCRPGLVLSAVGGSGQSFRGSASGEGREDVGEGRHPLCLQFKAFCQVWGSAGQPDSDPLTEPALCSVPLCPEISSLVTFSWAGVCQRSSH